jgi:sugar lactone lactonase YvrE
MLESSDGNVYLTAIEKNAIVRFEPASNTISTVVEDKQISWPDSLSWGPDGALYVSCSQIQNSPRFNNGKDVRKEPYKIFKIMDAAKRLD